MLRDAPFAPPKEVRAEEQLLNEPLYQAERPRLVEYITQLQQGRTPQHFFDLHRSLLVEFGARQRANAETLPGVRAHTRAEIARLVQFAPRPLEEIKALQVRLGLVERQERVAEALQHALRVVADGIAWKALGYERAAIALVGRGRRVGRLATGVGLDAELASIGHLWEAEQIFAIHNDMTNCLRHGDLTTIKWGTPMRVNFAEVKASATADASRQLRRLDEILALLQRGEDATAPTDLPTRVLRVPGRYRTYLSTVRDLIAKARVRRFASAAVHPAIRVGVMAFGAARAWRERAQKEAEQMLSAITPNSAFTWTWTHRRLRDRGDTPPAFAPLSIFPFPPEDVADLILGFVDVVVRLDIARLEGALRAAGLEARIARAPESATQFLVASRGQIGVRPPTLLREQMMNELMTPASLVRSVESMITLREQGAVTDSDRVMIVFDNESQTWA